MTRGLLWCTSFCFIFASSLNTSDAQIRRFLDTAELRCPRDVNFSKLKQAIPDPEIIERMTAPAEKKSWDFYRKLFLTQKRIDGGKPLIKKTEVQKAAQRYDVPAAVIVAVMGVETLYGTHLGRYKLLDALSTLAFHYPKRETFFQAELACYLNQSCSLDPSQLELKGSYAGAFGIPQFMPCSYQRYAVSQGSKHPNLFTLSDAAESIAHYLKKKGKWHVKEPIVRVLTAKERARLPKDLKPTERPVSIGAHRNVLDAPKQAHKLWCPDACYWLYPNFDSIMTYNISHNYALAVALLAEALTQ